MSAYATALCEMDHAELVPECLRQMDRAQVAERERGKVEAVIKRLRGALEHIAQYPGPHTDEAAHWRAEAAHAALAPATPPAHEQGDT